MVTYGEDGYTASEEIITEQHGSGIEAFADDDTFLCKKVKKVDGTKGIYYNEDKRLQEMEDRLMMLESKMAEQEAMYSGPSVIKLEQAAIPRACHAIYLSGETEDGIYQISPDGRCPFEVFCDMKNGGWAVIQRRKNGAVDFQRPWADYVEGFGYPLGDLWLGLEKIHRLTKGGSQILFTLGHYNTSRDPEWAFYETFAVSDVLTGYRMNMDTIGYKGSLPELLSYHNDQQFSTMDRDNDLFSHACSARYGGNGGWWYQSCYRLGILNGNYGVQDTGGISIWQDGPVYFKDTEIKLKPRLGFC